MLPKANVLKSGEIKNETQFCSNAENVLWAAAGLVVLAVLLLFGNHSGAKTTEKAPSPSVVEVAPVEQTDIPLYQEWLGTLTGR